MTPEIEPAPQEPPNRARLLVRGIIRIVVAGLFVGTPLLCGAGTLQWPRGWLFLGLMESTLAFNLTFVLVKNPALFQERWKRRKDTKGFDKVIGLAFLFLTPAMFVVAGLDAVRFDWTAVPASLLWVGAVMHVVGHVPVLWSMLANPHLETTVRIQTDRDHRVVSEGPYRLVRHPMYVGVILIILGWPLILGSWAAVGAAAVLVLLLVVRTALEDRTLRNELEGYAAYTEVTRYRLVPGLW